MRVLTEGKWEEGSLDYFRRPEDYRLRVLFWRNLARIEDVYFVRRRDWGMILNYAREIGVREVARKVRSRRSERRRNEKLISCGVGRVLEAPENATYPRGSVVGFVAPCHPPCAERVVLPEVLLSAVEDAWEKQLDDNEVLYEPLQAGESAGEKGSAASPIAGWSPYAGTELDEGTVTRALRASLPAPAADLDGASTLRLPAPFRRTSTERRSATHSHPRGTRSHRASAVLFGYGNYARTTLLPNVASALHVECIHELDPLQIPICRTTSVDWDTSPLMREDEDYEVFLVAGYHSTHAPIATEALRRGASAVVEKPVATTADQLERLLLALESSSGSIFSCYQRRYSPLTALARRDLRLEPGDPVSYHCIVYEVPLPARHWYRWPASGSRLLSNGCHWIDHFLNLNDYAATCLQHVFLGPHETINCSLELVNGACFTMALTDLGSARLGVRDHVELRRGDVTVTIDDNSRYRAESSEKVLRTTRINKVESYRAMYTEIARRARAGEQGDSPASVRSSAGTVLALDSELGGAMSALRPAADGSDRDALS